MSTGKERAAARLEQRRNDIKSILFLLPSVVNDSRQVRRAKERASVKLARRKPQRKRAKSVLPNPYATKGGRGPGMPFRHILDRFTGKFDAIGVNGFKGKYEMTYHATKGYRFVRIDL